MKTTAQSVYDDNMVAQLQVDNAVINLQAAYDAFEAQWSTKTPPEDMMNCFGPWPFPEETPELIKM